MVAAIVSWATAFVWTLVFELPVYAALLPRSLLALGSTQGEPAAPPELRLVLKLNLATHPAFGLALAAGWLPRAAIPHAEAVICLVEAALVRRWTAASPGRALAAAVAANLASWWVGGAVVRGLGRALS